MDLLEPARDDELRHRRAGRESLNGIPQIGVGLTIAGEGGSEEREDTMKIKSIRHSEKGGSRQRKIKNNEATAGFQNPGEFPAPQSAMLRSP